MVVVVAEVVVEVGDLDEEGEVEDVEEEEGVEVSYCHYWYNVTHLTYCMSVDFPDLRF